MAYLAKKKLEAAVYQKKGLLSQKKIEGCSLSKKMAYLAKKKLKAAIYQKKWLT